MMTLRLDKALEKSVEAFAKNEGISRSELVRRSIVEYITKTKADPVDAGRAYFGKYASGNSRLARDSETILRKKLAKRPA